MQINQERLMERIRVMSQIGKFGETGVTRLALTEEDRVARDQLKKWFSDAHLISTTDSMGNLRGRLEGSDISLPPIVMGSHLDSVPQGGQFDGVVGVIAALEVIFTLRDHDYVSKRNVDIINFTNEEGARFQPAMLASGVMAGVFSQEFAYNQKDSQGITLLSALDKIGYRGNMPCKAEEIHAYIELHIEQGPVLEKEKREIGIVDGILGIRWYRVRFGGESNHAGPTPMDSRRDALVTAARLIQSLHEIGKNVSDEVRATVGKIGVSPNIINTIPGTVECFVDLRAPSDKVLNLAEEYLFEKARIASQQYGVIFEIQPEWAIPPTTFDQNICAQIEEICSAKNLPHLRMKSGAGHDAQYMARVAPTAMIFIPSIAGRSHCEQEYSTKENVVTGCQILLETALKLAS